MKRITPEMEMVKIIDSERGILNNSEIYMKLKGDFKNQKLLAQVIASKPNRINIKKCKLKNKILVYSMILFSILIVIKLVFEIIFKVNFQIILTEMLYALLIPYLIKYIRNYSRNAFKGLIYYSVMFIILNILTLKVHLHNGLFLLSFINLILSAVFIMISLNILPELFPSIPREQDENGDYIFKD